MGRVTLNASETRTGTVHFKCVWSCLQMLVCTSISCIGVTPIDTYSMLFRYSICHGCRKAFFFFSYLLYLYMSAQMFLLIPAAFLEQSLLPLQTFCVISLKSSCSHQIQILMAWHPFKNPLKALVTFQATCFLCFLFIHLIQKKINKTLIIVNQ